MEATFRLFDATGKQVCEVKKIFNHKRHSMACAARQKFLDSLAAQNPAATTAELYACSPCDIGCKFILRNGRSHHNGYIGV